jgi:hypothetical protein
MNVVAPALTERPRNSCILWSDWNVVSRVDESSLLS